MTSRIGVIAPSNIALVKYWGKKDLQRPINSSLSMTLSHCVTKMWVEFIPRQEEVIAKLLLEGKENAKFKASLIKRLIRLQDKLSWLSNYSFHIETENTFPHSAGIASSASSMAALAFALTLYAEKLGEKFSLEKASEIARLLSGSACRSLFPSFVSWEEEADYARPVLEIHPSMQNIQDAILIIDSGLKKVSSSDGHALIDHHPFKEARIKQAHANYEKLLLSLETGNFSLFDKVVREEALTLHALMMTSDPSYFLMKPNGLKVIELIMAFKKKTGCPLTFTLDAGPNIHLLYPEEVGKKVTFFIENELKNYCENAHVIYDKIGKDTGAAQIE